ncbi:MAG: protein jag [Clostridiales bacterium]|nr:protein jag [Clostridiales bacterium]
MLKEAIGTGSTIDAAKEEALKALNAPEDAEIKFETLEVPTKKVFGLFGGSPAKVKVSYEVPDPVAPKRKAAEPKAAEPKPAGKTEKAEKAEKKEKAKKPQAPAPDQAQEERKPVFNAECNAAAENYITSILTGMGVSDVKVTASVDIDCLKFEIECGDGYGTVIGRRGETLDAVQYLTRLFVNKNGGSDYKRVSINVGNYREKREQTLSELAVKYAEKVKKYGRNFTLDPMNPYERRVIHTTVQGIEGVTSHSIGDDSNRRVVISPTEEYKKPYNSRGRYNNRGSNRGGYNRRPSHTVEEAPARAPRSDVSGASLYGRIEPRKNVEE